jgi:hypothetical protein
MSEITIDTAAYALRTGRKAGRSGILDLPDLLG